MDYTAYIRIGIEKKDSSLLDEISMPIKIKASEYKALKELTSFEKGFKHRTVLLDNKGHWIASKKEQI